jgi:hypothetical protein
MSVFSVARSSREVHLIDAGYERAVRGLHIERAKLASEKYLRPMLVKIARDANHRMVKAIRAAKGQA